MISKKFIRNSLIYTIAGSLPLASAILLLPFYLRYLLPDMYGALALYLAFTLLVQTFVTYSFDSAIYVYFHEFKHDKKQLDAYVSSVFIFVLGLGLVVGIVLSLTGAWLFELVFTKTKISFYPYGMISVLTGILQSVFRINSSLQQTQEKAVVFLWYNVLSFSMIALFTIAGLQVFPNELTGPIGGRFLAVTIAGVWVLVVIFRDFGFHFDFKLIQKTFSFTYPTLGYQVIQWFNGYYDKVMMTWYLPLTQIGFYDFAVKCLLTIEFALTGAYNSFFPRVLGTIALQTEKKTTVEINRYYYGLTAVTILLVTFCIFSLPPIVSWVIEIIHKPGYLSAIRWFPYIAITYLLRTVRFYVAMPYSAIKYSKPLPFFYLAIVSVKIGSMAVLLPMFGIMGAIIATWIGYGLEVIVLFFGIRRRFQFSFNLFKTLIAPVLMAVIIWICEPLIGTSFPWTTHISYMVAAVGLLAWAYRREIKVLQWSKILK